MLYWRRKAEKAQADLEGMTELYHDERDHREKLAMRVLELEVLRR